MLWRIPFDPHPLGHASLPLALLAHMDYIMLTAVCRIEILPAATATCCSSQFGCSPGRQAIDFGYNYIQCSDYSVHAVKPTAGGEQDCRLISS
jgi:hypothetical protein